MNEADALDIVQYAVWTVLVASAPVVLVAMAVGIGIALIQALTQIQEITLTFVPKIVAIMLATSDRSLASIRFRLRQTPAIPHMARRSLLPGS